MTQDNCSKCSGHHAVCKDSGKAPCETEHQHEWTPCPDCRPTEQEGLEAELQRKFGVRRTDGVWADGLPMVGIRALADFIHQKQIEAGEAVLGVVEEVITGEVVGNATLGYETARQYCIEAARKAVEEIKKGV